MRKGRQYLAIDLKSFYASVECVDLGLDPMTARLVVADPARTASTICLAVSPAMKALGVRNRCRVFEIPRGIDYVMAHPRMQRYIDKSAEIYRIYLDWFAKQDIHVYSIDEVFVDVTGYLDLYGCSARELGERVRGDVVRRTGIPAACGLGSNLYLAKVALDIVAKRRADFFGQLDEGSYRATLWNHRPITDFWRVGPGIARRLAHKGIRTMGELAIASEDPVRLEDIYREFGVDAEILVDHAWGVEPVGIAEIKAYQSHGHSLSNAQVLGRSVDAGDGLLLAKEMAERLALQLVESRSVARSLLVWVGFAPESGSRTPCERGQVRALEGAASPSGLASRRGTFSHAAAAFEAPTSSRHVILDTLKRLWPYAAAVGWRIKRIGIVLGDVESSDAPGRQLSFFDVSLSGRRECRCQQTVGAIKRRYGRNALIKGIDLLPEANARERNEQIGGHRAW